jgi:geranylgeranylglyceryl phosphate synthase family protein
LVDPNKQNAGNVAEACVEIGNSDKIEYWVGCTSSSLFDIRRYLSSISLLKPRYLYPSRLSHFFAFNRCDRLAVPILLNARDKLVVFESKVGSFLCKFLKRSERMAYLVTNPHSSVGKRTRARDLNEISSIEKIRKFFAGSPDVETLYIEAGSGSSKPVSAPLVKQSREVLDANGDYELIVGGGIRDKKEVVNLFKAGADKVVVGTSLELDSVPAIVRKIRDLASF